MLSNQCVGDIKRQLIKQTPVVSCCRYCLQGSTIIGNNYKYIKKYIAADFNQALDLCLKFA